MKKEKKEAKKRNLKRKEEKEVEWDASLVSAEKKTGANVNVSCFIASIAIKNSIFTKWPVVGRTASVVGRRPTMPYPSYATNSNITYFIHFT
jgi:hypothetical protein